MSIESIRLPSSPFTVSRIGIGCEALGGCDWGTVDLELVKCAVAQSFHCGINLFDTADVYGLGRSEELLSVALGEHRNSAVIISKFGIRWEVVPGSARARTFRDASRSWTIAAVENSLRRMRLECIPIYVVHWPDPATPVAETINALNECRRAGKIRCIGVSNFSVEQIREAHKVAPLSVAEVSYNLVDRQSETEILPLCQQLGISVIAYGPLAQGLLTGKYGPCHKFDTNDRRHRLPQFQADFFSERSKTVERLRNVSSRYGKTLSQLALRWVLDHPAISCVVAGAKSARQVEENVGALGWTLAPEDRQYLANEDSENATPSEA